MVRGFVNGNCKPIDELPGQSYANVAGMLKQTFQWVLTNHAKYRVSHVHISAVEVSGY
jgi:hypothetical protein